MSWWAKDLLTFSNLPSLPISILALSRCSTSTQTLAPLVLLSSGLASFLFHATENGAYNITGIVTLTMDHEVGGDGYIVEMLLPGNLLKWGRANTAILLKVDEVLAVLAVVAVLLTPNFIALKPLLRNSLLSIIGALALLVSSDFYLTGNMHAIVHSAWHVMAFNLAADFLVQGGRRYKIS